jgi:hypothetical protein
MGNLRARATILPGLLQTIGQLTVEPDLFSTQARSFSRHGLGVVVADNFGAPEDGVNSKCARVQADFLGVRSVLH